MATFEIRTNSRISLEPISFTEDQMREFGDTAIGSMQERMAGSVNVFDAPAKPLTKRYAAYKKKIGANPVRNLRLSGHTLASLKVRQATAHSVTVGFESSEAYRRALFSQNIDPLFGLSPSNESKVLEKVRAEFTRAIERMKKK
jgi:hypothetical protein